MIFCHGSVFAALNVQGGPGQIVRIEVDDNYNILSNTVIATLPKPQVPLGLACDPRDDDANFKLYFSRSTLYAQGGNEPYSPYGYDGQVRPIQCFSCKIINKLTHFLYTFIL